MPDLQIRKICSDRAQALKWDKHQYALYVLIKIITIEI